MNFKALTLALAATFASLAMSAAQAQSLSITPTPLDVKVGQTFSLDVQAADFSNAILGGGFELAFDAKVLHLDSVVIPTTWEFARSGGTIDNNAGTVTDAFFATFSAPKAGAFLTGTLNFTAVGVGSSAVTLSANALQPFTEDVTLNSVNPAFKSGLVNVAAVPEPSSVALALAGLGMAGWIGSRRQNKLTGA